MVCVMELRILGWSCLHIPAYFSPTLDLYYDVVVDALYQTTLYLRFDLPAELAPFKPLLDHTPFHIVLIYDQTFIRRNSLH